MLSMPSQQKLAVYIHFPYCKSRCPYCDFFRALKPKNFDEKALIERYKKDMAYFGALLQNKIVSSVFFGGGTPSLLSADSVKEILDALACHFVISQDAEISLEANPNTYEHDKFAYFRQAGINRLSLGVQALDEKDLKFLGRTHSLDEAKRAMEAAVTLFEKSSIDLIYARPYQQWESWQQELKLALSFGLKHISLYQLSIEEGTFFYKKGIKPLDDENAASLYEKTVDYLRRQGLERYEVSNFARDTRNQSAHNLVYWRGDDYIGIGDGAHGRCRIDDKIVSFVDGNLSETLSASERAEELLFMGLRLEEGINLSHFKQCCGIDFFDFVDNLAIKRLAQLNLICHDATNIRLTDKGFLLLDRVVLELLR